jgi:peptidoglycan/LPS O-acetylase OafA/YrhL
VSKWRIYHSTSTGLQPNLHQGLILLHFRLTLFRMLFLNYQKEIDGLRAIAVISIILFHLDVRGFSGGFVGVDVFFVISGYLITRLIKVEVSETQGFSYSRFYVRRARRLFPSLFFTLCLCFIFAFLLFGPQDFQRFGGALIGSASGLSNFYFWSESGYFDVSADTKPLLHVWSLSVEEQFYILWPVLIVFLLNKISNHKQRLGLLIIGISSLLLNYVFTEGRTEIFTLFPPKVAHWFADGPATIFYLVPFRVFEFTIGAILVWLVHLRPKNKLTAEVFVLIGLAMIIYPVIQFTKDTLFPSYNALLPCFGTALMIHSGTTKYTSRLLNNQIAVGIGLISYSLYLIHWPIIVFYKYWKFGELILTEQLAIFFCSIVVATLMYKFIEQPFRQRVSSPTGWSGRRFGITCALLSLLIVLPSIHIWGKGFGWTWRAGIEGEVVLRENCLTNVNGFCHFKTTSKYDFAIVGDSFAGHLYEGFKKLSQESFKSFVVSSFANGDKYCDIFGKNLEGLQISYDSDCMLEFKDFIAKNKIKRLIISYRWPSILDRADRKLPQVVADNIESFLTDKRLANIEDILLILSPAGFAKGLSPSKCDRPTFLQTKKPRNCDSNKIGKEMTMLTANNALKRAKYFSNITFLDPFEAFCTDTHCQNRIDGRWVYYDYGHLSKFGSIFFIEHFKSQILEFLKEH